MVDRAILVEWDTVDWEDTRIENVLADAPLLCMSDEPLALDLRGLSDYDRTDWLRIRNKTDSDDNPRFDSWSNQSFMIVW